jgi:hypothetical protein
MSGWLAFVALACALAFTASAPSAHALAVSRTACGGSSSASSGASTQTTKGAARISLNTARGVAGTQVVVSGTGWPVGQHVLISVENLIDEQGGVYGTRWLSGADVNAYSGFTTPAFSFPYLTCGIRPKAGTTASIVATTEDTSVRAVASFAVGQTPTLEVVSPQQLSPLRVGTTTIAVTGNDWTPGASLSLVAARSELVAGTIGDQVMTAMPFPDAQPIRVLADAQGRLNANVPIPAGLPPGTTVDVQATATSSAYGTLVITLYPDALIPAPAPPTWDLSANRGAPGMKLTVTGEHWWPTDFVSVEYCRIEAAQPTALGMRCNLGPQGLTPTGYATQLGEAVVDGNGYFLTSVTLPANAKPGAIIVEARLLGGNTRAEIYFASQQFTLTAPALHATSFLSRWRDWSPEALVGVLALVAALFVFWPRIRQAIGRRPASVAPSEGFSSEQEGY